MWWLTILLPANGPGFNSGVRSLCLNLLGAEAGGLVCVVFGTHGGGNDWETGYMGGKICCWYKYINFINAVLFARVMPSRRKAHLEE